MTNQTPEHSGAPQASTEQASELQAVRERFSAEEWHTVLTAPGRAALYIMTASPSGITGVMAEMQTVSRIMQEQVIETPSTPLERAMAHAFRNSDDAETAELRAKAAEDRGKKLEQLHSEAREGIRQAMWLVSRLGPDEARNFGELLQKIAEQTASASTNGGLFGIGGERVTAREQEAIAEVRRLTSQA